MIDLRTNLILSYLNLSVRLRNVFEILHHFFNGCPNLVQSLLYFLLTRSFACLRIWELMRYEIRRIIERSLLQNLLIFCWNTKSFTVWNVCFQHPLLFLLEILQKMILVFFAVVCFYYFIFILDNLLNKNLF